MKTYEYIGVDRCGKYKYYNIIDYYTCAECSDFYDNEMELTYIDVKELGLTQECPHWKID